MKKSTLIIKKQAIKEILSYSPQTREELMFYKRKVSKKYNITILKNSEILKMFSDNKNKSLKNLLKKREVRTLSGVAPIAVLTKPFSCPAQCVYCPSHKTVPKSYLPNEPAVMRALRNKFNPYRQVWSRLKALTANGHNPEKIELIIIGGTWSVLPQKYKFFFIKECFRAANDFNKKSFRQIKLKTKKFLKKLKQELNYEQKRNEKAKYKIIGITLETRPDYINEKEILEMRELGCTRVELGVQAIDNKILKKNKRGHDVETIIKATQLLRNYGFKITYHLMPGLPGSNPKKDLLMFKQLFFDANFQPDQIKFYPTVVVKNSKLYYWWKKGKYKPYSDKILQNLIISFKNVVPEYVRIIRLIRDIPSESIEAGNKITNLRQIIQKLGIKCKCIRCREVKNQKIKNLKLKIIKYKANNGWEYFIQAVNNVTNTLYGFCRLRLSDKNNNAFIRELHIYGELTSLGEKGNTQHIGLGKLLMKKAEKIAKRSQRKTVLVIAGIGVRNYYRRLGYRLKNTYMIKNI